MSSEGRSYELKALLGEGGFGRVYRATLRGPEGFSKDVAIKLLLGEEPPKEVLQRFRDESRILGLVRDRAIVGVDAPIVLGNRWAVVMEYVEGVSCAELVEKYGALPPGVAVGIVQEVARALDCVYRQPGPDGRPLELLHRDIKPANIQITSHGGVRLLDFGVARAIFEAREAATLNAVSGTPGYMAPERMEGLEGPEGDVYSLGVLLRELVTGRTVHPMILRNGDRTRHPPQIARVLQLASTMHELEFEDRPTAREVEDACVELLRELPPPTLRRWAEVAVRKARRERNDPLVGRVLREHTGDLARAPAPEQAEPAPPPATSTPTATPQPQAPGERGWWLLASLFGAGGLGLLFLGVVALAGAVVYSLNG